MFLFMKGSKTSTFSQVLVVVIVTMIAGTIVNTISGLKKKKRKAAAKKKKKTQTKNNKGGITIHSSTNSQGDDDLKSQDSENGYVENELIKEGYSSSSVGLDSKLKSMEGSSNDGVVHKPETESKKGVVGGVEISESEADTLSRSVSIERDSDDRSSSEDEAERVSSTSQVESQLVGNNQSLKKEDGQDASCSVEKVVASDDAEASTRDLIEKAVSDSEVEDISIVKTESLDAKDLPSKEIKDKLAQSENVEAIVIEKTKDIDSGESVSKDENRMVSSLDALYVGNEDSKDRQSIESSHDEEANVPIVPREIVKRTSWKSCCGLFDVVTGDHR